MATSAPVLISNNALGWQRRTHPETYFPHLPVLDKIVVHLKETRQAPDLKGVVFIGVQHLLKTTGSLFTSLIALGARPENMFFAGKCYSTDPEVARNLKALGMSIINGTKPERLADYIKVHNQDVKNLWLMVQGHCKSKQGAIKKIIIISDGAAVIENALPIDIDMVAVEQTRNGMYSETEQISRFPIINVAQSAAKQLLEPVFIQQATLERLKPILNNLDKETIQIGVVGYGAIGKALVQYFLNAGYKILVYDRDPNIMNDVSSNDRRLLKATDIRYLMIHSHHIFGCTGQDITKEINLLQINGKDRVFYSLSSGDTEMHDLLVKAQGLLDAGGSASIEVDTLGDIAIRTDKGNRIFIKKGGFPVNFDRAQTPDEEEKFSLTRGLLLGGILQALRMPLNNVNDFSANIMLDPDTQRYVVGIWQASLNEFKNDPQMQQLPISQFNDTQWIAQHSAGTQLPANTNNPFSSLPCVTKSKVYAKL
jgi:hypothetical protein